MRVFYADQFVLPLPEGHRFPMQKYRLLRDALAAAHGEAIEFRPAPPASPGELALVHAPAYIDAIATGSIDPRAMREIGFPWSEAMAERARRSVGATIAACRSVLVDGQGVAANIAGGTHHSYADKGGGFCVFNDAAVAARLMQTEHLRPHTRHFVSSLPPEGASAALGTARRRPGVPLSVAIVDLDVHQGNGTAHVFRRDDSVFTLSMHGAKNFPFRKEASDLDVDLPDGCGDDDYLAALEGALAELERRFEPKLVIYLAGADPHEGDRLGRLKLTWDGLEARDRRVFDWCWQRRVPLALTMAGGYGVRIEDTLRAQTNTFAVAVQYARRWQNLAG